MLGAPAIMAILAGLVPPGAPSRIAPAVSAAAPPLPCPVAVTVLCGSPPPAPPPPLPDRSTGQGDAAGQYLIDPGRSGQAGDDSLAPPLYRVWTRKFDNLLTYPLIAGGRVFVGLGGRGGGDPFAYGGRLFALSLRTGRVLWRVGVPGTYYEAMPAYDHGRVFVLNWDGVLRAVSASDGRVLWRVQTPANYGWVEDPPIATGGSVYVLGGGNSNTLSSLDQRTGAVQWTVRVTSEYGASMAVDRSRVFVDSCSQLAAYSRFSGALVWSQPGTCQTSPYGVTVLGRDLAANDGGRLLDAASGRRLRSLPWSLTPPIRASGSLVLQPMYSNFLEAISLSTGVRRWRRPASLAENPLVVGRDVFGIGEGPVVRALDASSGAGRGAIPLAYSSEGGGHGAPPVALASAGGYLIVPDGSALTAYVGLFVPPPRGIALRETNYILVYGRRQHVLIDGRLGAALRAAVPRPVELQSAPFPFRRFGRVGRGRSFPDGGFGFTASPSRNTLYRVLSPGARVGAGAVETSVYPSSTFAFRYDSSSRRVDATVKLRFDPAIRLVGQPAYIYLDRIHVRKLQKLAGARLRGGRGRATLRVSFPPVRSVAQDDLVLWCVPHLTRLGMGFPDIVDRFCGRALIRYQ